MFLHDDMYAPQSSFILFSKRSTNLRILLFNANPIITPREKLAREILEQVHAETKYLGVFRLIISLELAMRSSLARIKEQNSPSAHSDDQGVFLPGRSSR